jgi:hypothetical protein
MAAKLPETLMDLSPWGWSGYATPEVADEYALELGWNTKELDELKLVTPETKTYAFYDLADGRTCTQFFRVKSSGIDGEYVQDLAADD